MVNSRFDELKIVVIREAFSWESVSYSEDESVWVVFTPYQKNKKRMGMICPYEHGVAVPNCDRLSWWD